MVARPNTAQKKLIKLSGSLGQNILGLLSTYTEVYSEFHKKTVTKFKALLFHMQLSASTLLLFLITLFIPLTGNTHGSVVADADLCIIQIGYYQAHFKIYLPREKQLQNFCEDIPSGKEAVFVMEYTHGELGEVPMDFRIISDVTGLGNFARWEDVQQISNKELESATVFYQPPLAQPDVFTVLHHFEGNGQYLGIVTAPNPNGGEHYAAVFPFEVGYTRFGYLPLFLVLLLAIQGIYWFMIKQTKKSNEKS